MSNLTLYITVFVLVGSALFAKGQAPCPNPTGNFTFTINNKAVTFTNSVTAATTWKWDFGDGTTSTTKEPTHNYVGYGIFNVCLSAFSDCSQAFFCNTIILSQPPVITGIERVIENRVDLFPNPVHGELFLSFTDKIPLSITIINSLGETVLSLRSEDIVSPISLNFTGIAAGPYQVIWKLQDGIHSRRILKAIE